ncbi:DUF190 domain-containing protein [bacterium]|nr:DUF190 domain-containing protein [bacterium]
MIKQEMTLLRIFFGEKEKHKGKPLFEAIVQAARKQKLAGATVLKGVLGFGAQSHMHSAKILRISEDLPMIVEMVDTSGKIEAFLPELDGMMHEGMVTLEDVRVIAYPQATV